MRAKQQSGCVGKCARLESVLPLHELIAQLLLLLQRPPHRQVPHPLQYAFLL